MDIRGTKTEKNLKKALAGESIARNRYTFFAEKAKQEGLEEAAEFLEKLAQNEKEHARIWYKILNGNVGTTLENINTAAKGERDEWTDMYVKFAEEAREEGFHEIAQLFTEVKRIERNHERELMKLASSLKNHEQMKKEIEDNTWVCGYCGFHMNTKENLEECPLCHNTMIAL